MGDAPVRILAVCGSLQAQSSNHALLDVAHVVARGLDADVSVAPFDGLRAIPPFDPDVDASGAPAPVVAWRASIAAHDALLVASPEYGFSLPGALKNAIDWAIGSGELEGKVIGVTAAVKVEGRGRRGLEALLDALFAVSARVVGGAPIVRGASFDRDVAALVAAIAAEVRAPSAPPAHGLGVLRPSALASAWLEAWNRGDVDALAALYAGDATLVTSDGREVHAADAIRAVLAEELARVGRPRAVERTIDDRASSSVAWRDADGRRGCTLFAVRRGVITRHDDYAAGPASR